MGVASLVLGILACIDRYLQQWCTWMVRSNHGNYRSCNGSTWNEKPESKGIATAGLVLSIVGLALCLIMYAACVACVGGSAALFS